jgi:hypothetical protein
VAAARSAICAAALLLAAPGCAELRDQPRLFGSSDGGIPGGAGGTAGARGIGGAGGVPTIVVPGFAGAVGPATGGAGGSAGRPVDARPPPDTARRDGAAPMPMPMPMSPVVDVAPYLGGWRYVDGTLTISCADDPPTQDTLVNATFQIQRGIDTPLEYVTGQCIWPIDVTGGVGSFRVGEGCATANPNTGTVLNFTVVSGRFAPTAQTATVNLALKATSTEISGACDVQVAGTAVKVPGPQVY